MDTSALHELLEYHYRRIHCAEFISGDPLQFAHRYSRRQDIEIAGILCATIAWGRRSMIISSCEKMMQSMGSSPYEYLMNTDLSLLPSQGKAVHRTFSVRDFAFFLRGLQGIYSRHQSLEEVFAPQGDERDMWNGISRFRAEMLSVPHHQDNERHISSPEKGSACKRLHLFLRWMVREGGIDIGLWKNISPSVLSIPLDVHVGNISRHLGILSRRQNDRKAVEQIDAVLRTLDPNDPAKYDYALFGLGESGYLDSL